LTLLPLAITSTKGWMRRLGKNWKRLHRLIYLAALLVIIHFVWLVKSDVREPLAYGAVVLLLLALRLKTIRRALVDLRERVAARRRNYNRVTFREDLQ
jgi:sulfoxide reductase heme-binding subunit YedZ